VDLTGSLQELTCNMFIWPSKEKDSNTYAFSRAEAWQRSTVKMLCHWNHLR